jgi:hypothetical protein
MVFAMVESALIEVLLGNAVNGIIARISHQMHEPSLDL